MSQDSTTIALPITVVDQLEALCGHLALPTSTISHKPTFSAAETQAVLPPGCLVQKTVTDRVAGQLVVWTGVGDFRIARRMYLAANQALGLPSTNEHTLNPHDVSAVDLYNMQPGMVSPFLIPDSRAITQVSALFFLDLPALRADLSVAISLSLEKSLLIPLNGLRAVLYAYAASVYSHIPIYSMSLPKLWL